ncbi:hypothetical protein GD627_00450 [Arthrobacter yangruifuii]|uniref:N-acetyltransferase domain-containing protein n=2 Tax=Arthrobacter yangruifuii TaxID=2606616 RepID=A0A5N6MU39_9MICC|nr:hypothetical protein GD627_00450 [Arthrobacter yangruifuii]
MRMQSRRWRIRSAVRKKQPAAAALHKRRVPLDRRGNAWQSLPMTSKDIRISRNEGLGRYELRLDGALVGIAEYEEDSDSVALTHTEMESDYRHQGYSSRLAKYAVEDIVSGGGRIKPYCSYMAAYLKKHPEYSHHVSWPQD